MIVVPCCGPAWWSVPEPPAAPCWAVPARTRPRPGARRRPVLTHGVQSGDVTADSALVWTRADRPGRMLVEVSRRPDFRERASCAAGAHPNGDFTGKVRLRVCRTPSGCTTGSGWRAWIGTGWSASR
ncbi:PhoD-like phosphatase N-terminal domain-containing protein [Micromonospora sp. M12]